MSFTVKATEQHANYHTAVHGYTAGHRGRARCAVSFAPALRRPRAGSEHFRSTEL